MFYTQVHTPYIHPPLAFAFVYIIYIEKGQTNICDFFIILACFLSTFLHYIHPFPFFFFFISSLTLYLSQFGAQKGSNIHKSHLCFLICPKSSTLTYTHKKHLIMEKETNSMFFNELNCSLFKPNWENSMDQGDPFESALSSMVSSPTASNANGNNGENIVLRELIGRLGSICNSGEISPHQNPNYINSSANTSCYSTPLNSPPKLNLSMMESNQMRAQFQNANGNHFPSLAPFATDPAFVERAARFSCFASKGFSEIPPKLDSGKISRVSSNQCINVSGSHPTPTVQENWDGSSKFSRLSRSSTPENGDSRENSSVSEQIAGAEIGIIPANSRKRKSNPKGKGKESPAPTPAANVIYERETPRERETVL